MRRTPFELKPLISCPVIQSHYPSIHYLIPYFALGAESLHETIEWPHFFHAYKNPHVFGFLVGPKPVYEAKVSASL